MFNSLTALFTVLSEGFKSLTTVKEHQSETDVIKTKKEKSKAVEVAEEIITYIDKNFAVSSDRHYQRLKRKFFRYN